MAISFIKSKPFFSPTPTQTLIIQYKVRRRIFNTIYLEIDSFMRQGLALLSEEQQKTLEHIECVWTSMGQLYRNIRKDRHLSSQELEKYTVCQIGINQKMRTMRHFIFGVDASLAVAPSNEQPHPSLETPASVPLTLSSLPLNSLVHTFSDPSGREIARISMSCRAIWNAVNLFNGKSNKGYFQTAIEEEMRQLAQKIPTQRKDLSYENLRSALLTSQMAVQDGEQEAEGDESEHSSTIPLQQVETIKKTLAGNVLAVLIKDKYGEEAIKDLHNVFSSTPNLPLMSQALLSALDTYRQVAAVKSLPDPIQSKALVEIATHLVIRDIPQALVIANAIPQVTIQSVALQNMVEYLRIKDVSQALAIIPMISDEIIQLITLQSSIKYLKRAHLPQALAVVYAIPNEKTQSMILESIVKHLMKIGKPGALAIADTISDETMQSLALRLIANHFITTDMPQALKIAYTIPDEKMRSLALKSIVKHVMRRDAPQALAILLTTPNAFIELRTLKSIVKHLNADNMPQALREAYAIFDEAKQSLVLQFIARHLKKTDTPQALAIAHTIANEKFQSLALKSIAKYVMRTDVPQALEIARIIPDEGVQSMALRSIAEHVMTTDLPQALAIARTIPDEELRHEILKALMEPALD